MLMVMIRMITMIKKNIVKIPVDIHVSFVSMELICWTALIW